MGGYGSGKTSCWLNIAKWSQLKQSPAKFYAIDTDGSLEAMLDGPPYDSLTNVVNYPAFTYEEMMTAVRDVNAKATHDDWVIADIISFLWEAVQTSYVDGVFNANMADFYLEARKAKAGGNALDGWKDWSVINKMHKEFINLYAHRTPGHKFMVATAETVREGDPREIKSQFGKWGYRPGGQKHLGNLPHTLIMVQAPQPGQVFANTIKDRQRTPMEGQQIQEFAIDYLVNIAGWTL